MKITIFKGFSKEFYAELGIKPLIDGSVEDKFSVGKLASDTIVQAAAASYFINKNEDERYLTYEEFEAAYDTLMTPIFNDSEFVVVDNNIYPDIYPAQMEIGDAIYDEYQNFLSSDNKFVCSKELGSLLRFYSEIYKINDKYYVVYHNREIKNGRISAILNRYEGFGETSEVHSEDECDFLFDISDNMERYIECIDEVNAGDYKVIGYRDIEKTSVTERCIAALGAFCKYKGLKLVELVGEDMATGQVRPELAQIAKGISGDKFKGFRNIPIYKNPRISNETVMISQGVIMEEIVQQAENAKDGKAYRDIFFTAPTGAGKSLIFQVPARYIADNYNKLVIVVEPLKGLMRDQVNGLKESYGDKARFINSDISSPAEKEQIIRDIKENKVNILYVSPETLISRTIDQLVGEREIGLMVIDEAHIVTTWGMGFRPDYWYLGAYINRLRSERNGRGFVVKDRKHDNFPIFACTATAVNGGSDDTVSETVISLTMNDPIIHLGEIKRKNIKFNIDKHIDKVYNETSYEQEKADNMSRKLSSWLKAGEKTIVYTPYRSIADKMKNSAEYFSVLAKLSDQAGIYTGDNGDPVQKMEDMEKFSKGEKKIMYATKAFGMGIDIDDVNYVYHYAPSGNLADYVQEIGRAARRQEMTGYAVTDYYERDVQYMKRLYGMSQIKQTHVMRCIKILYDVYKQKGYRQKMIVAPSMFSSVFGMKSDDESLHSKLKIALLMIEKDFYDTYRIPVIVTRPVAVFTTCYVRVNKDKVGIVTSSKYAQYFKEKTSFSDERNGYVVYELDLGKVWENKKFGYSDLSFQAFKHHFYENKERKIMPEIHDCLVPQVLLEVEAQNNTPINKLYDEAKRRIGVVVEAASSFGGRQFTPSEFAEAIAKRCGTMFNKLQIEAIASSFFGVADPYNKSVVVKNALDDYLVRYSVRDGNLRNLAESILDKSAVMMKMQKSSGSKFESYITQSGLDAEKTLIC